MRFGVQLMVLCASLGLGSRALAQDRFEIQVYDAEIAPPGGVGVELHYNTVADGTSQPSADGELATNHLTHLTLEPHVGIASWCELGGYLQAAVLPDGSLRYAGVKLRWKMRIPHRFAGGLIGLALNLELSIVPAAFEANVYGSELRPVIDVRWKRLYFALNPIIGFDLGGAQAGRPQIQPAFKFSVTVNSALALGIEYYAAFGPVTAVTPAAEQVHRLFAVLDVFHRVSQHLDFDLNAGVGYNLTGSGDRWVAKAIFGLGH